MKAANKKGKRLQTNKAKRLKIKYVDYGLANNFGSHIEINRELKKHPKLLKMVISHEKAHTNSFISAKDILLDMDISKHFFLLLQLSWFALTTTSTWCDIIPISWRKGESYIDVSLLILELIFIIGVILALISFRII